MTNAELITELRYCANIEKRKLLSDAADALEALQAQMPKRGECKKLLRNQWINYYECSICGNRFDDAVNYCPNCGAKMLEGERNEQ